MKEDLEFDIEGEIFEHFMTLQNFYKIFQDSLGIVQFIFLWIQTIPCSSCVDAYSQNNHHRIEI